MEKVNSYSERKMQSLITRPVFSLCLLFVWLLFSSNAWSQCYKVVKIDSTENHYLISVSEEGSFKGIIVSEKKVGKASKKGNAKIEIGQEYKFDLEKYRLLKFINRTAFETETSGKGGITIDGKVVWKASDDYELYQATNVQGLFYSEKIK